MASEAEDDYYDEEKALADLLNAGVMFLNNAIHSQGNYTTCVFLLLNDIFAWGCADAECVTSGDGDSTSELAQLHKLWLLDKEWGAVKWACLKRNERPQRPVMEMMKKDGAWDAELEALPDNYYDKAHNVSLIVDKSQS